MLKVVSEYLGSTELTSKHWQVNFVLSSGVGVVLCPFAFEWACASKQFTLPKTSPNTQSDYMPGPWHVARPVHTRHAWSS
jgi:hypothetical protein